MQTGAVQRSAVPGGKALPPRPRCHVIGITHVKFASSLPRVVGVAGCPCVSDSIGVCAAVLAIVRVSLISALICGSTTPSLGYSHAPGCTQTHPHRSGPTSKTPSQNSGMHCPRSLVPSHVTYIAFFTISAYARLLMSSEVQAKCRNRAILFTSALPLNCDDAEQAAAHRQHDSRCEAGADRSKGPPPLHPTSTR